MTWGSENGYSFHETALGRGAGAAEAQAINANEITWLSAV
jgi:hypothetical protein